jgi:hypothetical protein
LIAGVFGGDVAHARRIPVLLRRAADRCIGNSDFGTGGCRALET